MKEVVSVYEDRIFNRTKHNSKKLTVQTNLCPDVAILRLFPSVSVDAVRSFFEPPMKGKLQAVWYFQFWSCKKFPLGIHHKNRLLKKTLHLPIKGGGTESSE